MTTRRRLARLLLAAIVIYLVFLFLFTAFQEAGKSSSSPFGGSHQQQQQPAAVVAVNTELKNGISNTEKGSPSPPEIKFKPSSFDWTTVKPHHPIPPSAAARVFSKPIPHPSEIQWRGFKSYDHTTETQSRREAVRSAFLKSWTSYARHAFGADELAPLSGTPKTTFGGWSATLIDSLDTLHVMNLTLQFAQAASHASQIDFSQTRDSSCNLFETTIRHLGGLLSAYDLSLEPALLQKAKELGDMLYLAFDTPQDGIPPFWFDFRKAKTGHLVAGSNEPSAAMGSLSLEFTRLSLLTGEGKYRRATERVMDFFETSQERSRLGGVWPKMIDFRAGAEGGVESEAGFGLGALADSLYEYLVKMVALTGGSNSRYESMYLRAKEVIKERMVFRPMVEEESLGEVGKGGVLFVGDLYVQKDGAVTLVPEMQHLTCFAGGMFALGGRMFGSEEDVEVGERLARGCAWAYSVFPTGIMPEISALVPCEKKEKCEWDEERWKKETKRREGLPKGFTNVQDARYILRPEAIESVFVLYRITGKEELRDAAWSMFKSVMKATETELGNSAIADVTVGEGEETKKLDSMESFWFAETLKYFYLIFSPPDLISLDDYVFNTEAHPFRRPK